MRRKNQLTAQIDVRCQVTTKLQRNDLRSVSWSDRCKDTPTETAQDLTDDKDRLVWREESDEDESIQKEECHDDDFAVAVFGGEPSIQEDTRDNTDVTGIAVRVSVAAMPTCVKILLT
jgi:hypothetical protein